MQKLHKIIIVTFTLYMLLCIPAFAAQTVGGFVSNTPMAAGPNASIGEVWMKHGGARLQYDALMGSVQMNTNGRMRRDPAAVTVLPPLYPQQRKVSPSASRRKDSKKAPALPMAQQKSKQKNNTKINPSPKPVLPADKNAKPPYSGQAPVAPQAKSPSASNTKPESTTTATNVSNI